TTGSGYSSVFSATSRLSVCLAIPKRPAIEFIRTVSQSVAKRAYQRCPSAGTSRVLKCCPVAGEPLTRGVGMFQEGVLDVRQNCDCGPSNADFANAYKAT